jgi:hypothetical protein
MPPKIRVTRNTTVMMAILLEGHDSEDIGLGVASWSSEPSTPARSPFISSSWALAANDDLERTWDGIGEGAMLSREYAIFNAIVAYAILGQLLVGAASGRCQRVSTLLTNHTILGQDAAWRFYVQV